MTSLGGSVVANPTGDGTDFHLVGLNDVGGKRTFVYIPQSEHPGLTVDILRLDCIPRSPLPLEQIRQDWVKRYSLFAGVAVTSELVKASGDEFLLHASFVQPLTGYHHTVLRYARSRKLDFGLQFIRKLDSLSPGSVQERIGFLTSCTTPPDPHREPNTSYSEYALGAQRNADEIGALVRAAASGSISDLDLDAVESVLVGASPVHNELPWAFLARFFGQRVLIDGLIDKFDRAVMCLQRAVVNFYDSFHDPHIQTALAGTAVTLADILARTHSPSRPANVERAATLYHVLAQLPNLTDPSENLHCAVMALLASDLKDPESEAPLDSRLPHSLRQDLREHANMDAAVSDLLSYSEQMVHIARHIDISLCADATVAADLAQVLVERATADGGLTEKDSYLQVLGFLARAFDAQVQSQCVLYGLDLTKIQAARRAYDRRSFGNDAKRPLIYLRPLTTSKRIRVGNSFGPYYGRLIAAVGPLPADLSLEGALQIALSNEFDAQALAGPIDVFGMARATTIYRLEGSALDGWQSDIVILIAAASVILVIFEDSAGLLWEMAEIARQQARSRSFSSCRLVDLDKRHWDRPIPS